MIYFTAKLTGGVLALFAMGLYFALMVIVWAIGVVCISISTLAVAAFLYFTDKEPTPKVKSKKKPLSFKSLFKKEPETITMDRYSYTFKGNELVNVENQ